MKKAIIADKSILIEILEESIDANSSVNCENNRQANGAFLEKENFKKFKINWNINAVTVQPIADLIRSCQ